VGSHRIGNTVWRSDTARRQIVRRKPRVRDTFGGVFGRASLPARRTECRWTISTRGHVAYPDAQRILSALKRHTTTAQGNALGWSMTSL
jgi:hypothetical protein